MTPQPPPEPGEAGAGGPGRDDGGRAGEVEAEFCGKNSMAAFERMDEFIRKTGFGLAGTRFLGTLSTGEEVHSATFRLPAPPGPRRETESPAEEVERRFRERAEEFNRRMQDPEFRRKFFEDPVEAKLERLIEINLEIEKMLKGLAGGPEPAPGPVGLPEGPMALGKVAGSGLPFRWEPRDLKTHLLIAGQEGSGKSVAASVVVEEALRLKVPVLVFDPTGWWTGLLRPNRDEAFIRRYPDFGLKPEDARPFKGLVREVADPDAPIDFGRCVNPGEATLFSLAKMRPGDYDRFVANAVDALSRMGWRETLDLKLLLVFDEIHLLLEKYGGHGGYIALEKGAREFRKWGIGMVMTSRTRGHFREELRANVLTEVQMRTRNPVDLEWMRAKFGGEYEELARNLPVGEGLLTHPKFNRGKPVHVAFRPPLHQPGGLPARDLEVYRAHLARLDEAAGAIADLKKRGVDATDLELELKLAEDKLKEGRFRMAEVYTDSLRQSMERFRDEGRRAPRGRKGRARGGRRRDP